ncbi:MAG: flagellar export protein FliJ [Spirochaetales bacterium]|nr:flagellar export protein FliJ [Spirochaetales bacterium]
MRKFQFRLERILEIRRYHEREWELKLAEITGKCILLENQIVLCRKNIYDSLGDRSVAPGFIDMVFFIEHELFVAKMKQSILEYSKELEVRNQEREKVKEIYIEFSKKRKVLEKLKERREAEYYAMQRKEEFKTLDEINTSSLTRKHLLWE